MAAFFIDRIKLMDDINLTSPSQVKNILREYGVRPKKRLGQNFLVDKNVLNRIIDVCGVDEKSNILEIGPGLGTATAALANTGARVVCVEKDFQMEPILRANLQKYNNVEIVISDFLDIDISDFIEQRGGGAWIVVGNLPYYITTPIIIKLTENLKYFDRIVLMVQKEVAQRMAASPGTSDYGAFSVLLQYYYEVDCEMRVSRNVFLPAPDVDSAVVVLERRVAPAVSVKDEGLYFKIVRSAFGKRRKTLLNALGSSAELGWNKDYTLNVLERSQIDINRRGETLSLEEFAQICNNSLL